MTNIARDTPALLDPEPETPAGSGARLGRRNQVGPDDLRSYHRIGRMLVDSAVRTGRNHAASAAVEVFREALARIPNDASLRNGLGAALVERARLESNVNALVTLKEAMKAFQGASVLAARQAVPRAVGLRYEINIAMISWMLGERTEDTECVSRAVHILQSLSAELSKSSAHWSHVQDNLGNALMALGRTEEAIQAYQVALDGRQVAIERGRSLNNLGTAYAEQRRYAEACRTYRDALLLQPRDQVPRAWALTQHNLGGALLQEALARNQSRLVGKQLNQAIEAFEAARGRRRRPDTPLDWGVTTANLAGAYLGLGAHLCAREARPDRRTGAKHIRRAIELYNDSLPELTPGDAARTIENIVIALQMLRKASDSAHTEAEIHRHQVALLPFVARHDLRDLVDSIWQEPLERRPTAAPPRETLIATTPRKTGAATDPALPGGLQWPTESYAQAHKLGGENVVAFLSRVWLPLIKAGVVDLRTLRARDPSAAKAIDNFTQRTDPVTGERQRLPPHLHIPTKKDLNDKLAASIPCAGDRPARLDWALRSRARRAALRK
jgi:tetratricopeptide (TPR) repeat protein